MTWRSTQPLSSTTYVLYGVTDRDPEHELVCQFFGSVEDREDFAAYLPGRYDRMTLPGINIDAFDHLVVEGFDPHRRLPTDNNERTTP